MVLRVPSYYKDFQCIADRCQDSCCIGWKIDIDEDTFSYYKSIGGAFGERLRAHMETEDCNSFTLRENGWCPFLNQKKLCDICMELGEEALCEVCTEFPRFTMEYENVREKVLCLSCEEVGRLVFSSDEKITWEEREIADEYDAAWESEDADETETACAEVWEEDVPEIPAETLEGGRTQAVEILQDRSKPIAERAAEYLLYCQQMQQELYGCIPSVWQEVIEERKESAKKLLHSQMAEAAYRDFRSRMDAYEKLEPLDATWIQVKKELQAGFSEDNYQNRQREFAQQIKGREYEYEHLLVYFTNRYFMRAYYDANILTKAKFAVVSMLMIRDMDVLRFCRNGGVFTINDRIDTARIYAKEVEHSEENMETLADDLQFEDVFEVERLLEQL